MPLNLSELRRRHVTEARPLPGDVERALRADARPTAQAILRAVERRRAARRVEGQRLKRLLAFERALYTQGIEFIAGVDEAGSGPLAGPVAAAAVILPRGCRIERIDDSKKLDAATREHLRSVVVNGAVAWSTVLVEPEEIDRLNIYWACIAAMTRAVLALRPQPQHVLVDARKLDGLPMPYDAIIKGDAKSQSIAAASILAKTTRDAHMVAMDARYPGYGFARHKGYPVPEHKRALRELGPCPIHRRSFQCVKEALAGGSQQAFCFEQTPATSRVRAHPRRG